MSKRILFIVPYPLKESPSQRYRFEQYLDLLERNGYHCKVHGFLTSKNWRITFEEGHQFNKLLAVLSGMLRRVDSILRAPFYSHIFIHREALPIGPPVVEWLIARVFRKKIIYDFDDAIWATDRIDEPAILRLLKWRNKVALICGWSYKVSCGNDYLCSFASKYSPKTVYNPTTIDTRLWHNPDLYSKADRMSDRIVIGWTGSHSTLKYLKIVERVLQEIETLFPNVSFVVIANKTTDLKVKNLTYVPWSIETEIADLMQFDIGIMPLPDDDWSKGKCGFKALQYMALKIPAVTSDVGANSKIIQHDIDGLLCKTEDDWKLALTSLIENSDRRKQMGERGREKVVNNYSVVSNSSNFLSLFE
jgi:glycosyltransferase involved in cell wall biosynthesis